MASFPPLEDQLILPDSSVKGIWEPAFQLLCNRPWLSTLCWGHMLVLWLREGGRLEFSKKDAGRPHIKDNICLSGCVSGTKQRPLARHWREDKLQSEVWPACSRPWGHSTTACRSPCSHPPAQLPPWRSGLSIVEPSMKLQPRDACSLPSHHSGPRRAVPPWQAQTQEAQWPHLRAAGTLTDGPLAAFPISQFLQRRDGAFCFYVPATRRA